MTLKTLPTIESTLPKHLNLFYGGEWHTPRSEEYREIYNPGNGKVIDRVGQAGPQDVDEAVAAAHQAFLEWRQMSPTKRAAILHTAATVIREHAVELALLDAYNSGNPIAEMLDDANVAADQIDYFAGLIPMLKGETIPQTDETFHYTVREPLGVTVRIVAYNHPILFAAGKLAAPLAAGNTVILKPSDQAPLSCLRLAELLCPVFPTGVINVLPGGLECGKALSTHPTVKKVTLIGSVPTGKTIQRAVADSLKPTLLELGGKNALVAFPDAKLDSLVEGVARGMNFTWAAQSCGSTSRVFLHESHYEEVLSKAVQLIEKMYKPGVPTNMSTTMGPVINESAHRRVLGYIESAKSEGARLVTGGKCPDSDATRGGYFIEPTVFVDVNEHMKIAKEEIFGPVLSVFKWKDEEELIRQVNAVPYGLTASVYTQNLATATRTARKIEAGYIWVNQVAKHYLGVPFGGYKDSGVGREECLEELLSFTQTKSVNVNLN